MKYNYIAIEGNIGAGKTTLAHMLAEQFNARLVLEQFEDNSFLPKFYKEPEKYAFPLELSFLAERYQQLKKDASRLDLFQEFTIADYFIQKSLIFSRKTLQSDEYTLFTKLFNIIISQLPQPDLMIYLYVDINRLLKNIQKRGRSYEQEIQYEYLERIQKGYLDFIAQQTNMRILVIDSNQLDFVASHEDYELLLSIINCSYPTGVHRITPK
jgi:deoxyadenosine/deoxycytidine kinase